MFHIPFLYEYWPLTLAQGALTIWMLVDSSRRGVESVWFWIILWFQPIGPWAYFFVYKIRDFRLGSGFLTNLLTRRASLEELRYRVEQSPTVAAHLDLADRLLELKEFDEAVPHLQSVLAREPDHGMAMFALAECHRRLGRPADAVPLLEKLIAQRPNWRDDAGWRALISACQEAGDHPAAVGHARRLAQVKPSLEHRCLLADCLLEAGNSAGARTVIEKGLEEYRFTPNPSRNDRRWVGKAKKLLKEIG